jgi:predicted Zn-dependent peptidase
LTATSLLSVSLLLGCPKAPVETPTQTRIYNTVPEPLAPRAFQLPELAEGALSNGISVSVVENHEVPFVYVQLIIESGSWTDPADQPGLARATMDMLNEGTASHSASELSTALRALASDLGSSANLNGGTVSVRSLTQNLEPTLDLMASVALTPTFPAEDWSVLQANYIQEVKAVPLNPSAISRRAWNRLMYGSEYGGHLSTVEGYESLTVDDMSGWHSKHMIPANTSILVGGDTTLEEILPLLEARFGGWEATGELDELTAGTIPAAETGTIYLIDKPGAAQSIVRLGQEIGDRQAEDAMAFEMANVALGGQFTARINMNLREDKGWTYGASSWLAYNHYPGVWSVYSSVVTPHTADSVKEILNEVQGMLGDRPMTQAELDAGKGDRLGSWPVRFEQPSYLLDSSLNVQRYGLPDDWLTSYPDRIRSVTLEQAQAAFNSRIDPNKFIILVVGDAATVRAPLEALGIPVVMLSNDGNPLD